MRHILPYQRGDKLSPNLSWGIAPALSANQISSLCQPIQCSRLTYWQHCENEPLLSHVPI